MTHYDVIVIGSGAGNGIIDKASRKGLRAALVDKGPLGGTCLNQGCIPSKLLITVADRVMEIEQAPKLGVDAKIQRIDFGGIMSRMRESITSDRRSMRSKLQNIEDLDLYEERAVFIDDHVLQVSGQKIRGDKIFIASGARPLIPPIDGLDKSAYLTNETVLDLKECPKSIIIVGGGYIAAEYGHFFAAMGCRVTIFQRGSRLVEKEEPAVSTLLEKLMGRRMDVHTRAEVISVAAESEDNYKVTVKHTETGETEQYTAQKVMVAAGRVSNADLLEVNKSGVETDEKGYIVVDDFQETTCKNIYALGDALGRGMFRHAANHAAVAAWQNAMLGRNIRMDFRHVPHAVFSYPQIAGVGLTQAAAEEQYDDILVGTQYYKDITKGEALGEEHGFAKVVVLKETGMILGCHIIGPHASILIQEVVNVMVNTGTAAAVLKAMHIHPALSELIQDAMANLQTPS